MREIKWDTKLFKVWDGKKFWDNKVSIVNGIDEMFCGEVDDLVFLENTFLLDKNGVEIYEGDIVEHNGYTGVVYYNNDEVSFFLKNIIENEDEAYLSKESKVIGNIYENKELLNG